jgi:hypothetical protein
MEVGNGFGAHYLRKWDSAGHSTLVNQMRSSESEERNVIAGNGERERGGEIMRATMVSSGEQKVSDI